MIISVASGKGGTCKTLVATSLALFLKDRERLQLLDRADKIIPHLSGLYL